MNCRVTVREGDQKRLIPALKSVYILRFPSADGRLLEFPSCPSCGIHNRNSGPAAGNSGRWSGGGPKLGAPSRPSLLWASVYGCATLELDGEFAPKNEPSAHPNTREIASFMTPG
jgi:hypothetical protein